MNLTKQQVLQAIYKEFSSRKVERFTLSDLSRISDVSRNSIYYNFECLDYVYKAAYEQMILTETIENSKTIEDFFTNLITCMAKNKNFCLSLYHCTSMIVDDKQLLTALNKILMYYGERDYSNKEYLIMSFIYIIKAWLDKGLRGDEQKIIMNLKAYMRLIRKMRWYE